MKGKVYLLYISLRVSVCFLFVIIRSKQDSRFIVWIRSPAPCSITVWRAESK